MYTLKIMTFNICVGGIANNRYPDRRAYVKEFIERQQPDVIGFQEASLPIREALVEDLTDYYIIGGGRDANYEGEAVSIAFRKDKFTLFDCETFWLSNTPNIAGSRYAIDQSACPRVCTWATLKPKAGKPFRFYNVHTDHVGEIARIQAATQVIQKIAENNSRCPMPSYVTGDFNERPDCGCIKTMLSCTAIPLVDLMADCGATFHNFDRRNDPTFKIDYIFAPAGTKCLKAEKLTEKRDGLWLSDHYPLMATIEVEE